MGDRTVATRVPLSPGRKFTGDPQPVNGHLALEAAQTATRRNRRPPRSENQINGDEGAMEMDSNGIDREPASVSVKSPSPNQALDADGDVGMGMDAVVGGGGGGDLNPPIGGQLEDQEPSAGAVPPSFTLTTGQSVGVQITPAKAADLSPNVALVDVAGNSHVTTTLWRPHDPTLVAVAGESFCGLWRVVSSNASSFSLALELENLVENRTDGTCVSTVAWDPTGQRLAVATYNELRGAITMYDIHGAAVDLLPDVPRMITGLHWADRGSHMAVVASDGEISELALWDSSMRPDELAPPQVIDRPIYDLTWAGDHLIYACGEGSVYECEINSSINVTRTFTSEQPDTAWTFIRTAKNISIPVVVTAAAASGSLWVPNADMHIDNAHHGDITAIDVRKYSQGYESQNITSFILASSSTDDTVKIWKVDLSSRQILCLHRLFLSSNVPALSVSFSPDGYAVTAASKEKLYIWNVERGGPPMATWTAPDPESSKLEHSDRPMNGENGSSEAIPYRCLSWDSDGKKLAMGLGKQVRVLLSL